MLLFLARLVHLACKCARLQKSLSPGFIARCGACPKLLPPLPQATYVATDITYIFVFFFYFCVEAHLKCKTFETISTTAAAAAAISWSKLEAVVVVRSYFLTPLEIRANVNEPNPHPPTPVGGMMLHVCGVLGGLRGSAVDLFLSSALSQFVFSSLTVSLERDEIQLSTPLFLFILPPPLSLSFSASTLVSISSACWSDKCVCDLCGGEFSCHCHLCFSASSVASSKELKGGGGQRKGFSL